MGNCCCPKNLEEKKPIKKLCEDSYPYPFETFEKEYPIKYGNQETLTIPSEGYQ